MAEIQGYLWPLRHLAVLEMNRNRFFLLGGRLLLATAACSVGCMPSAATSPATPVTCAASPSATPEEADESEQVDGDAEGLGDDGAPAAAGGAPSQSFLSTSTANELDDSDSEHADLGDDIEEDDEQAATPSRRAPTPHPLDGVSDAEIFSRLKQDSTSLGSMSIGLPNGGMLINAVQLPTDTRWTLVSPGQAYGTTETVDYLVRAMSVAAAAVPETPPYFIGHLSARGGGYLKPHRSHQSGRDVDIGYVYQGGGQWYQRATEATLDLARSWALVRALITETDPQFILIDHSIQGWLYDYAVSKGEDRAWLDDIFKGTPGVRPALIRHVKGHATHLHVRFWNPIAEQTARRSYSSLVRLQRVQPPTHFVTHKAKKGETLIHLAKRYGTTVRAIKVANGLRSNKIMARKQYRIPQKGVSPMGPRSVLPERRLPPTPVSLSPARKANTG